MAHGVGAADAECEVRTVYKDKRICLILPVLVIDDGSRDATAAIAERHGVRVIRHVRNLGVGAAFNTGIRAAHEMDADIVVNMDADGQFNPADMAKLIDPIIDGNAAFVTASRFRGGRAVAEMSRIKYWGNRLMSRLISSIADQRFSDVSCGFRAYSRDALDHLNLFGRFTYTQESFLNFAFKGVPILEVPLDVRGKRAHGRSRVAGNLFKYVYYTTKIIVRTYRDYRPFRFFSAVAIAFLAVGLAFFVFLAVHYARVSAFTPHKWAGFVGAFFILLGIVSLFIGFVLDMFARMRLNQERIIYRLKKLGK
jgi:glycosyltransferase involved in cell wall biosynthesis